MGVDVDSMFGVSVAVPPHAERMKIKDKRSKVCFFMKDPV